VFDRVIIFYYLLTYTCEPGAMATTCPREKLSVRNEESFWRRAFWALPLLGIFLVARTSKLPLHPDTLDSILRLGQNGSWSTPQTLHAITFLADITCLNAIVAIESCRGGRSLTTASVYVYYLPFCSIITVSLRKSNTE
jgi:hypothetical protein